MDCTEGSPSWASVEERQTTSLTTLYVEKNKEEGDCIESREVIEEELHWNA